MTRGGIEYDLRKSPFRVAKGNFTFVFSSEKHARRFLEIRDERKERLRVSLSNRFNIDFETETLADFLTYREIEKRGFLILDERGEKLCQNKLKLNILKQI